MVKKNQSHERKRRMDLRYICGITFAPFAKEGSFMQERAKKSLALMKERTGANYVVLAPNALQDTPQSEKISYTSKATLDDDELKQMIEYAHGLGLGVILKPAVNCKNGTWRAFINFFDNDIPCEPKWGNWFTSYAEFQRHYAAISQQMGCEIYIAGCEMVMSEHREAEWRQVIADVRSEYHGLVSYNADKYQEENVKWWDCVDIISTSGYYPLLEIDNQLNRIEKLVKQYNKPFLFAEGGCMSVKGASELPNSWWLEGEVDLQGQAAWYDEVLTASSRRDWVSGWTFWSWTDKLYPVSRAESRKDYEIYGKPAERVVHKHYTDLLHQ